LGIAQISKLDNKISFIAGKNTAEGSRVTENKLYEFFCVNTAVYDGKSLRVAQIPSDFAIYIVTTGSYISIWNASVVQHG
jgi:hypothetical protein